MTFAFPGVPDKLNNILKWARWATGEAVEWQDQNRNARLGAKHAIWGELRPVRIEVVGEDEIRYEDLEDTDPPPASPLDFPLQACVSGTRLLVFQFRMFSRSQEHNHAAWHALMLAQTRIKAPYARSAFFRPKELAIVEIGDVINMPVERVFDQRVEDIALFEFTLSTVVNEIDETAIGTWIESIKASSDLNDAGGVSLDPSLQLDDEVMP